jgi:hypothetical protein
MQRAEALFDAPVHLLYIARAQQKLGLLVESSESYRKLGRVSVDASASAAFKEAVESGQRELPEVEARVAALRVDVEPKSLAGLSLSIDGQPVPAAIAGVERPTNPGHHTVRAEAPGYTAAETSVDLSEGEKKQLALTLHSNGGSTSGTAAAETSAASNRLSFFVGLRLAGVIPAGNLYRVDGTEVGTSELLGGGVFAELHGGARFARYFAVKLYLDGLAFAPGRALRDGGGDNTVTGEAFGIGAMVGTPPRQWGGFGEIGLSALQRFHVKRDFGESGGPCGNTSDEFSLSGLGFRIGGGAHIPVHRLVQLTPFMLASFGQISSVKNDACGGIDYVPSGSVPSGDRMGHQLFILGVGGDLLLGL